MGKQHSDPLAPVVAKYSSGRFYRQALGAITAFLRPKLLTPEYYGLWTILKLIPRYAAYAHLGTRSSLRYLIPTLRGREDQEGTATATATAFWACLGLNLIVAGCVGALALYPGFSTAVRLGLAAMAMLVLLHWYYDHLITMLKAHEQFGILTRNTYFEVTLAFLTTAPLVYLLRIYGLYLSVLITVAGSIVFLRLQYAFARGGVFDRQTLWLLLRKGFPIELMNLAVILITTCDRIIVGALLGSSDLGHYGIAVMVMAFLINIPGTAREVLEPRMMRTMDDMSEEEAARKYLFGPLLNTAYLLPLLAGPVFLALPVGVPLLLPRYTPGIPAAQTLTLGVYFLALAYIPRIIIIARDWQRHIAWRLPPILVFNIALGVLLVRRGYGLFGVAISSTVSFALLALVLLTFLRDRLPSVRAAWHRGLVAIFVPAAAMPAALCILSRVVPIFVANEYLAAGLSLGLYCALFAALHRAARARMNLISDLHPGDLL